MSIDVLAIALRRTGLCCETNAPTLKPLAQKLPSVSFLQAFGVIWILTLYSFHRRLNVRLLLYNIELQAGDVLAYHVFALYHS
jgi:hypothetical protein